MTIHLYFTLCTLLMLCMFCVNKYLESWDKPCRLCSWGRTAEAKPNCSSVPSLWLASTVSPAALRASASCITSSSSAARRDADSARASCRFTSRSPCMWVIHFVFISYGQHFMEYSWAVEWGLTVLHKKFSLLKKLL